MRTTACLFHRLVWSCYSTINKCSTTYSSKQYCCTATYCRYESVPLHYVLLHAFSEIDTQSASHIIRLCSVGTQYELCRRLAAFVQQGCLVGAWLARRSSSFRFETLPKGARQTNKMNGTEATWYFTVTTDKLHERMILHVNKIKTVHTQHNRHKISNAAQVTDHIIINQARDALQYTTVHTLINQLLITE